MSVYFEVQPMNARTILKICQLKLWNDHFDHHTTLRRRLSTLIGTPGTGKTSTIISLISVTYSLLP